MSLVLERLIPPLPRVERGKPVALDADPNGLHLLYVSGNSVVLRNLKDLNKSDMYTEHSGTVNVARYSPSGFYIASADRFGKVRIWDTINAEHILKNEFQPFSGPICDLAWTFDNQRIIVGGTGQSQFGAVFNSETGASAGVIMGMSKNINSVDFRPVRPFRAITGNDEGLVNYFEGPPFTFKHLHKSHSAFVNVVRFCPSGDFFVSAGSDGKIFAYDGQDGSLIGEVGDQAHAGGIYGVCFSKDGSRMISASADKSLKLWEVTGKQMVFVSQYTFDNVLGNMLLGCCWVKDTLVVASLSGSIHLFDAPPSITHLSSPRTVLRGHASFITCGAYSHEHKCLVTASSDSTVAKWDIAWCRADVFSGEHAHKAHVQSMALTNTDLLVTVGFDDRCVLSDIYTSTYISSLQLPSQPRCVGVFATHMLVFIGCDQHLVLANITDKALCPLDQQTLTSSARALTVSPSSGTVLLCCENDQFLVYKTCRGVLLKLNVAYPASNHPLFGMFSPDGSMVAFAAADRSISVYMVQDNEDPEQEPIFTPACSELWQRHSARITALGWSPNSRRIATGSLDTCLIVWSLDNPKCSIQLRGAHPMSNSTSISWTSDSHLASTALDGSIRCWKVSDS
ncbi:unnamed protein product [Dicrocoelium dendriticum]|nr:unnamed protein product [Dicrocoelium dendriticum]